MALVSLGPVTTAYCLLPTPLRFALAFAFTRISSGLLLRRWRSLLLTLSLALRLRLRLRLLALRR